MTAERAEIERRLGGVAQDHAHVLDGHVDLVGHDLRERGADPLSEVDLAGEGDDRAVGLHADALREVLAALLAPAAQRSASAAVSTARIARP